jgi:hypothetical protein
MSLLENQLESAENHTPPLLIVVGLTLFFLFSLNILSSLITIPAILSTIIKYVGIIILVGAFVHAVVNHRRQAANNALVEIGSTINTTRIVIAAIAALIGNILLEEFFEQNEFSADLLASFIVWVLVAISFVFSAIGKVYLVKGDVSLLRLVGDKFERVSRFEIAGRNEERAYIYFKHGGKAAFSVRKEHKDMLKEILRTQSAEQTP